jgi:hypothetical protein
LADVQLVDSAATLGDHLRCLSSLG